METVEAVEIAALTARMSGLSVSPPPVRRCVRCPYNAGSPVTGLCASCDPEHAWWGGQRWIVLPKRKVRPLGSS